MEKQRILIRTLYRKMLRETQRIPSEASLTPSVLDRSLLIDNDAVKDRQTLQTAIRQSFRNPTNNVKEEMERAIKGLAKLYALDVESLPDKSALTKKMDKDKDNAPSAAKSSSNMEPKDWLQQVQWLEPISEMKPATIIPDDDSLTELPVFPLSGPLFPSEGKRLPVVSQFSDVPVSGMEIPLKIFEPRYRQMYNDLFSGTYSVTQTPTAAPRKCFIVPTCHPYHSGQFAKYGWLYEIMQVRDVADETNGQFQLVCNHLVTKPVEIHSIVNPQDFATRSTYIRATAKVLDEDPSSKGFQPLGNLLRQLKSVYAHSPEKTILVDRLLLALAEGSIWPVTQVWILNLQMQILDLQVKIANKIQIQASQAIKSQSSPAGEQSKITEEMILLAQEPHKEELQAMLVEVSTLVPLLLQDGSPERQCQRLCERIQERLGS
jgi:hypothetical protein